MPTYSVPLTGYLYVDAENATQALRYARHWSYSVMASVRGESVESPSESLVAAHVVTDENHIVCVNSIIDRELEKARTYEEKKVVPHLPVGIRNKIKLQRQQETVTDKSNTSQDESI